MTRRTLFYLCISAATALAFALQPEGLYAADRGEGHHAHAAHIGVHGGMHTSVAMATYWFQTTPPPVQVAGKPFSLTVTVRDALNGVAAGYTGTVTLSDQSDSSFAPVSHSFTAADKGVYTFTGLVLDRAFVHDLTIQDGSGNHSLTSVPVQPAPVAQLTITTLASTITGQKMPFFVTLWDAFGNVAWNTQDTLQISTTDSKAVVPTGIGMTTSDYGSRRTLATFMSSGPQTLTVTDRSAKVNNKPVSSSAPVNVAPAGAPQTFQVTSTGNSSSCPNGSGQIGYTLACAINDANNPTYANSPKTITFDIDPNGDGNNCDVNGVCTIRPSYGDYAAYASSSAVRTHDDPSALPEVSASYVTIDGTTQPNAQPNTNPLRSASGDNAQIRIQIDGGNSYMAAGLELTGNSETVKGLSITNFTGGPGLDLYDTAITMSPSAAVRTNSAGTDTALGDFISGNLIGVTPHNQAAGNQTGIAMANGPGLDTIGGTSPTDRNVISNSQQAGIDEGMYCDPYPSSGSPCMNIGHNTVQGNYIGTDVLGATPNPNDQALLNTPGALYAGFQGEQPFDQVGGYNSEAGNIFSGNGAYGFEIGAFATVQGDYVGTDPTGQSSVANSQILIQNDPIASLGADAGGGFDFIGGTVAGASNLFSGNPQVQLEDSGGYNILQGNLIGTTASGTGSVACMSLPSLGGSGDDYISTASVAVGPALTACPAGPSPAGIEASGGGDFIGFITPVLSGTPGNVISGNTGHGLFSSAGNNLIQGNLIGTTSTGAASDPNSLTGIDADGGGDIIGGNSIRSVTAGIRNVPANTIAGNSGDGVFTDVAPNWIQGNTITGNGGDGVHSTGGEDMVGGNSPLAANTIGSNGAAGIEFDAPAGFALNNRIGFTSPTAAGPNQDGIDVFAASGIQIIQNTIANNHGTGVTVGSNPLDTAANALISQNSMYANGGLGIDLAPLGSPTCASLPPGPNSLLNCPVIQSALGKIAGTAPKGSTVEVFLASRPAGQYGEGKTLLGTTTADPTTGKWSYTPPSTTNINSGQTVTATATLPEAGSLPSVTSEFAANVAYTALTPQPVPNGLYKNGSYKEAGSCSGSCSITITGNGFGGGSGSLLPSAVATWELDTLFNTPDAQQGSITGGYFKLTSISNSGDVLYATVTGTHTTRVNLNRTDIGTFTFDPKKSTGIFAGTIGSGSFLMQRTCVNCIVTAGGTMNSLTLSNVKMATP